MAAEEKRREVEEKKVREMTSFGLTLSLHCFVPAAQNGTGDSVDEFASG